MAEKTSHNTVLIMAGGAGTRLWPISRQRRPKQFQSFVGEETLLQHMITIASTVVPLERIFIMATPEFGEVIRQQIPALPLENLLFEPDRRDNGPAIVLGMLQIQAIDAKARVAILWSDHLIRKPMELTRTLEACFSASQHHPDRMVTIGTKPTVPETGYGYIQMGKSVGNFAGMPTFMVEKFIEKPDAATAEIFVSRWEFLWNVGYKVIALPTFFQSLTSALPEMKGTLDRLISHFQKKGPDDHLKKIYRELPKLSIEYLLTQYMHDLMVIPADLGWSDIGNWQTLHDVLKEIHQESTITKGPVLTVDTENSLIIAKERVIAAVGISDLVIVDDGDAILVMKKSACHRMKELISNLEKSNPELL
jgi:mannose-1-phosphate guanylyltransferase